MTSYLLIQISDVHLTADGSLPPGVRPRDQLTEGLRRLEAAGLRPDVFLLSGDLADAGDGACYQDLAGILGPAAARTGADVVYLPGNHDDRDGFRRHLTTGNGAGPTASSPTRRSPTSDPSWRRRRPTARSSPCTTRRCPRRSSP